MHRVYLPPDEAPLTTGSVALGGDEAHHAVRVRRLRPGEAVEVLDGHGGRARATVAGTEGRKHPVLHLTLEAPTAEATPTPRVIVLAATPKHDRAMQMVDQLSQLGAAAWTPLVAARAQDRAGRETGPDRLKPDRLHRQAVESMKQCGRAWLLEINEPLALDDALAAASGANALLLLADAGAAGERVPIAPDRPVWVLVGPEGGFTDAERAAALAAGARALRLGPYTLRTETAAAAAAALLMRG